MPDIITGWIHLLPIILPLGGAVLVALLGKALKGQHKSRNLGILTAGFLFASLLFIIRLFYVVMDPDPVTQLPRWTPIDVWFWPLGGTTDPAALSALGSTVLHIDMLGIFMSVMFAFLGFFVAIYSIRYMEADSGLSLYYALLLTLVGGMIGVVYAGDFLTLFIFWETMSISSYALVAFRRHEAEPLEAGIKYFLLSAVGSTLILFSFSILYGLTGSINITQVGKSLVELTQNPAYSPATHGVVILTITGLIIGFGVKAAIAPLATWLPDAHPAAPSGISAMLSGVVIMTGSYAILRTCLLFIRGYMNPGIFGLDPATVIVDPALYQYFGYVLSWFALFTMIFGNLMALTQKDLKRLLAFSSIVNVGYIVFGLSVGVMPNVPAEAAYFSVTGALFQMTTHMLAKGMLFLCSGVFLHSIHSRDLDQLRGIGRRMPFTMFCFAIGALSLIGVPPLVGFYSKFFIIWGSVLAGGYVAAAILVVNSAFSVAYYLRIIQILAFADPSPEAATAPKAPRSMRFSIGILTVFIIGMGLFPQFFLTVANVAAEAALGLV
jgi:multicomponent Na+:H+ antiporter subunit D